MLQKIMTTAICLSGACAPLCAAEPLSTTGPNVRLIVAPRQLTSQTSYALMGEFGEKTVRFNGTLGYQIGPSHRLKMSVDQLSQKLSYDFFNGKESVWVRQIAGGASYKYLLEDYYVDSIDAGGWYSNAQNARLSPFEVSDGSTSRIYARNVSGSEAWHAFIGTTLLPWDGGSVGLAAVYDYVDYRQKIFHDKSVSGLGFSVDFNQRLFDSLDLNVRGDILQPYQHVGGLLNWTVSSCYGDVVLGLYGDYTHGRKGLPSDTSFGIQFNIGFGNSGYVSSAYSKCCVRDKTRPRQDLFDWIADPAVLMPVVLAMTGECNPPVAGALPDVSVDIGPFAFNVSGAFSSGNCRRIVYSAAGLPPYISIDEDSGVISGINLGVFATPFNVTVTGASVCGRATSSFVLTLENI